MTATLDFVADPALSFWPTPAELADDLVYRTLVPGFGDGAPSRDGEVPRVRVLEPSAGDGHIIRAVREHLPAAHVTAVEPSPTRAAGLRAQTGLADEVVESTLEDYLTTVAVSAMAGTFEGFDLVIMNPPFTLDGRPEAWAEHVLAVYHDPYLLNPYGQISAVVPRIVLTGKSKLVRKVRELLHPYFGADVCERGAFDQVGAKVSAATIWIEKDPERCHYGRTES
jgi:predicted RNA methylase